MPARTTLSKGFIITDDARTPEDISRRPVWDVGLDIEMKKIGFPVVAALVFLFFTPCVWAAADCQPVEKKRIKVEGWISKKFKKQKKAIAKEFGELGHTRVVLKVFPMGETAKVVAVGRCVPAHLARHILATALKYTGGIESLVNQGFLSPTWVGIGTTVFDEPSQQIVNAEQVQQLLDPKLSTEEFHALYRKFSIQDDTVPFFGLQRPNAKKVQNP